MASSNRTSFEIISLSCQGLRTDDHRAMLFSWLNCCKVDFLRFHEIHSVSEAEFSSWMHATQDNGLLCADHKCLSSPGSIRSYDLAILYQSQFTFTSCSRDSPGEIAALIPM